MKKIDKTTYPNATGFKYDNARVMVLQVPNSESFVLEFKRLITADEAKHPICIQKTEIRKNAAVAITGIRISKEAAFSIMLGLQEQLKAAGILPNSMVYYGV
jgi:hypothetical protein